MSPSTSRTTSLAVAVALVASRSLGADSAPTLTASAAGQPWVRQARPTAEVGSDDVSVSFAATTSGSGAANWVAYANYDTSNCTGTPMMVLADRGCSPDEDESDCAVTDHFGSSSKEDDIPEVDYVTRCAADLPSHLDEL